MTIYTLYVKTHRKTGLKYLGQTSQDPFKYPGSGVDWETHLKTFGNDVETEILLQTSDTEERNRIGRYYSNLWHVVTAADDFGNKIWANRIPETGGGGGLDSETRSRAMKKRWTDPDYRDKKTAELKKMWESSEFKEKMSNTGKEIHTDTNFREMMSEIRKEIWQDSEYQSLITERRKETWQDPDYRALKSQQMSDLWKDDEYRERQSKIIKDRWEGEEYRKAMTERSVKCWEDPEYREAVITKISGKNNWGYDHTIYHFVNVDGKEEKCTRHDLYTKYSLDGNKLSLLVKGTRKSHKGWRIINTQ
jgi:hypothetical protein